MSIELSGFGERVRRKRQSRSIRDVAAEIDIGHATLSRIENGHIPDLETFRKICLWLDADPGDILGVATQAPTERAMTASVQFRKGATNADTATALGELIIKAQEAITAAEQL